MIMMTLLSDILKEKKDGKQKYSIGRILLSICAVIYFIITGGIFINEVFDIVDLGKTDLKGIKTSLNSIEYVFLILLAYILGGKGTNVAKEKIKKERHKE